MNLPLYIARRYLVAKKSHNLINVITAVSVVGVAAGAFALIVVLSVFNGFEQVISKMVNSVAPDLLIQPLKGKTAAVTSFPFHRITELEGIRAVVKTLEEDALFRYGDKQHIGRLKGTEAVYQQLGLLDDALVDGEFILEKDNFQFAVAGAGVAWYLGLNIHNPSEQLLVYVPRAGSGQLSIDQGFNNRGIQLSGIFESQQDFDSRYVFVPYNWAAELLEKENRFSGVEVFLEKPSDVGKIQKSIVPLLNSEFSVKDRYQQQETLYKIMRSEKWAIFIILTFILIMATFNVIGSLTMLIVDKQKDSSILKSFGASDKLIRQLFMYEGILIAVAGGLVGLVCGIILVLLQQQFGLLKLGDGSGSFVIDAYPVYLKIKDILSVFFIVIVIGGMSTIYTVWQAMRRRKSYSLMQDKHYN